MGASFKPRWLSDLVILCHKGLACLVLQTFTDAWAVLAWREYVCKPAALCELRGGCCSSALLLLAREGSSAAWLWGGEVHELDMDISMKRSGGFDSTAASCA